MQFSENTSVLYEGMIAGKSNYPIASFGAWPPERIKAIRKATGLSCVAFARKYGFNWRTVESWEAGYRRPSASAQALLRIAESKSNRYRCDEHLT